MRVLDLFSGIGGFSLGLERAGMTTVAFCEIDKFCQKILFKHWPKVPIYEDVRTLTADRLAADGISVDVICGGFPCQDISTAGKGAGLKGERSGLWREYARIIGELRPRYVLVENVSALLYRGLGEVLGDLASLGYDAEWHCIPASHIGAPHRRDRIWIIAYRNTNDEGQSVGSFNDEASKMQSNAADAYGTRLQGSEETRDDEKNWTQTGNQFLTGCRRVSRSVWEIEPKVGRVANGIPARMDRLKSLGNAVVPQIPELLGKAVMSHALRNA